jgi:hypothetical protein
VFVCLCVRVRVCVCVCVCMFARACLRVFLTRFHNTISAWSTITTHAYIHTYVHAYVRTYIRTHTHTHTYIHTVTDAPPVASPPYHDTMSASSSSTTHAYRHTYIHTYIHTVTDAPPVASPPYHDTMSASLSTTMHTYMHTYIQTCIHIYIHTVTDAPPVASQPSYEAPIAALHHMMPYQHHPAPQRTQTYIHTYIHTYIYIHTQSQTLRLLQPRHLTKRQLQAHHHMMPYQHHPAPQALHARKFTQQPHNQIPCPQHRCLCSKIPNQAVKLHHRLRIQPLCWDLFRLLWRRKVWSKATSLS